MVFNAPPAETDIPVIEVTGKAGSILTLPDIFNEVQPGKAIYAFIEGPEIGTLRQGDDFVWRYTPPAEFTGRVMLRFSVFDSRRTREGQLSLTIKN